MHDQRAQRQLLLAAFGTVRTTPSRHSNSDRPLRADAVGRVGQTVDASLAAPSAQELFGRGRSRRTPGRCAASSPPGSRRPAHVRLGGVVHAGEGSRPSEWERWARTSATEKRSGAGFHRASSSVGSDIRPRSMPGVASNQVEARQSVVRHAVIVRRSRRRRRAAVNTPARILDCHSFGFRAQYPSVITAGQRLSVRCQANTALLIGESRRTFA